MRNQTFRNLPILKRRIEVVEAMAQRTQDGDTEIVNLLKTSGYYAAASPEQMVEAIILNKKRLLPCSTYLTGQYGIDDLYIGVLIKLGGSGVEEIIEIELTDDGLGSLQHSAAIYKEGIELLGY